MCQRSISLVYSIHAKVRRNSAIHSATLTLRYGGGLFTCAFVCLLSAEAYQRAVKTLSVFCASSWQTLGNLFVYEWSHDLFVRNRCFYRVLNVIQCLPAIRLNYLRPYNKLYTGCPLNHPPLFAIRTFQRIIQVVKSISSAYTLIYILKPTPPQMNFWGKLKTFICTTVLLLPCSVKAMKIMLENWL